MKKLKVLYSHSDRLHLVTGYISTGLDSIVITEEVTERGRSGRSLGGGGERGGGEERGYLPLGPHTEGTLSLVLRGSLWQ